MKKEEAAPIYKRIAIDIAKLIKSGNICEGELLSGRSSLAGKYNVSPETIRRAIKMLEDINVVKSFQGSGSKVLSKDNAIKFVEKYSHIGNLAYYKRKVVDVFNEIRDLEEEMMENVSKIIDYSGRLQSNSLIDPFEFVILEETCLVNKTESEVMFWENTEATIVGVKREGKLQISPGPYFKFQKDDVVLVVANIDKYKIIEDFILRVKV